MLILFRLVVSRRIGVLPLGAKPLTLYPSLFMPVSSPQ